jgi:hypothetical protein
MKMCGITIDDVGVAVDTIIGIGVSFLGKVFLPKLGVVFNALALAAVCKGRWDHFR